MNATDRAWAGYGLALAAAAISGVAVYVNSLGVRLFADSATYTTLKNAVVGVLVLVPFALLPRARAELRGMSRAQTGWLIALAIVGGSVPYLLFFRGLQLTNAVSGAVVNHLQFAIVAVLAVLFLRERISKVMWGGLAVLVVVTNIGLNLGAVRWNQGTQLLLASSVLFAAGWVMSKHLLRGLSTTTVMTAKMTLGSLALFGYLAVSGRLGQLAHLRAEQWQFVLVTGLILFAFTATTLGAIKLAPVTAVIAIAMAAPLVTASLQVARTGHLRLAPPDLANLLLTGVAVAAVLLAGLAAVRGRARTTSPGKLTTA